MAYLAVVMLFGGGARGDIQSLVFLRPIAIVVCGVAALTMKRTHIAHHRWLFALVAAVFVLTILHLVPLPPSLWAALPERGLIVDIDRVTGLGDVWRPLSVAPMATWNALYALFVPLAALLLAIQLSPRELRALLPALLAMGLLSGLLGLLQVIGDPQGALYLYRVTNNGSAVGFFANRNHQAVFLACLFPMLAIYAAKPADKPDDQRLRLILALAAGLVLVPLLIITGSRAGMVAGAIGLLAAPLFLKGLRQAAGKGRSRFRSSPIVAVATVAVAILCLGAVTLWLGRAGTMGAVGGESLAEESRFQVWGPIAALGWRYFPFGSGIGSFVETYQVVEPDGLLRLTYLNHAHNDWLETALTGGLPAMLLAAAASILWAAGSLRAWRAEPRTRGVELARLASILLLLLGLASASDYPLRVPFLACFTVILALWLRGEAASPPGNPQANG